MFVISVLIVISWTNFLPASCRFAGFVPNHKYIPKQIPHNYLDMLHGKQETQLHKIDSETAFCGRNRVDIREITILQLQKVFNNRYITSRDLVECYLKRIELMNPFLNAVLETNPHAIEIAEKLDQEREQGIVHGPLHGIPVLLKDTMGTDDGMENTAGSVALLGLKPKQDSEVVRKLRKAGAIILGKANLSEFGNFRATDMPNGWSGRGGRTKNVFIRSADSSGSSSGSAVATAANMVTVALGGETDGSIISPSENAALVGLKTTVGQVSTKGCIGISNTQDVIGPIARTVDDAAIVFDAISVHGIKNKCFLSESGLEKCQHIKTFRIGVLRDPNWNIVPREQLPELENILHKLRQIGFKVIDPVATVSGTSSGLSRESETIVFRHEFKAGLNHYLMDEVHRPSPNPIENLADVIAFNIRHPPKEGYNQDNLLESEATDGLHNSTYIAHRKRNKASVQIYIDFIMTKYDLDAIVVPTDRCDLSCAYPAVAGYPHISIPAGFGQNGLPFGISFYGKANSEETLLEIAYKLEKVHKARRVSMFLD